MKNIHRIKMKYCQSNWFKVLLYTHATTCAKIKLIRASLPLLLENRQFFFIGIRATTELSPLIIAFHNITNRLSRLIENSKSNT